MQLRLITEFQKELPLSYCKVVAVSVDPPEANAAFKAGLGANFPILSDQGHEAIQALDIVDTSDKRHGTLAIPYAFSLMPDLLVHNIYCGWWYVGRPTVEELRQDLRAMMKKCRPDFDPQA